MVKAQEQVVSGTLHHLTIEAIDAGERKIYEAKVWVKPWMNFKELQEFKVAGASPSFTTADLGVKKGMAFSILTLFMATICVSFCDVIVMLWMALPGAAI